MLKLLGMFRMIPPSLIMVVGLAYTWLHRRKPTARFTLVFTVFGIALYTFYYYQAALFAAVPATLLGIYGAIAVAFARHSTPARAPEREEERASVDTAVLYEPRHITSHASAIPPEGDEQPAAFVEDPGNVAFRLSVIVPVFNERYVVEASLRRLLAVRDELITSLEVIVVDDGSTDGTREVLQRLADQDRRIVLMRHQKNRGKGAAVRTGIDHATGDITLIHDADLEYHPEDIPALLVPFRREGADAVFGSRYLSAPYRRALMHRHTVMNRTLTFVSNWFTDLNLTDLETCYKAVKTTLLKSIPLRSNDFKIEVELPFKLAKRRARIYEVPIRYSPRTQREGKKIRAKDGFLAFAAMVRFALIDDLYKRDEYGSQILVSLERARRFNSWMAETLRPYVGKRVLEIGAGIGTLTSQFIPRELYVASDINPHYLHYLHSYAFGKPYLKALHIDVTRADDLSSLEAQFDTVVMLNVLEHVSDEAAALRSVWSALQPGGRAIILVPHHPALFGTLDTALEHRERYTSDRLRQSLEATGFQVERVFDFNRVSVPMWWMNGKILRRRTFSRIQLKTLDMLVPLLKRVDRFWPWKGLSVIGIAMKPVRRTSSEEFECLVPSEIRHREPPPPISERVHATPSVLHQLHVTDPAIENRRLALSRTSLLLGTTLLMFHCSIALWGALGFLLRAPLSNSTVVMGALTTVAWAWYVARRWFAPTSIRALLITLTITASVFAVVMFGSGWFYDLSSDGRTYHQRAVALIADGWNPVYEASGTRDGRIDHYVWGPWLQSAVYYMLTGEMEQAKASNGLLIICAFFISLGTFLAIQRLRLWQAFAVAVALTLNPVSITQTLSFLVDGQVAALIAIAVCLGIHINTEAASLTRVSWLTLAACGILLISSKLTGVVYFSVLFGGLTLWFSLTKPRRLLAAAGTMVTAGLVGVFVVGTPLVSNTIHNGTPFYPLIGAYDMAGQMPANFVGRNSGEKILLSLLSKAQLGTSPTEWKIPFTFTPAELTHFAHGELRVSGFGPLFGGVILLTVLAFVISLVRREAQHPISRFIILLIVTILASVVTNPEAWWARFVPQLWLIPVLAVLGCFLSPYRLNRQVGVVLLVLLIANSVIVSGIYFSNQNGFTRMYARQLEIVDASGPAPVKVYFSNFYADRLRFDAMGIHYEVVNTEPQCADPLRLFRSETIVCIQPPQSH